MPTTLIVVDEEDINRVARKLEATGKQAANAYPAMQRIALDMMRKTGLQFSSKGHRGGGSWRQLRPATIGQKGNTKLLRTIGSLPGYSKVGDLENADTLFKSLTVIGAPYQVLNVGKSSVEYGTERPGAYTHQHGGGRNVPARPFIQFLPGDRKKWDDIVAKHIVKPFYAFRAP